MLCGGGVNAATDRTINWAVFLCEYNQLVAPGEAGSVTRLTGNNTVHDRALLVEFQPVVASVRWEDYLDDDSREWGVAPGDRPETVGQHKRAPYDSRIRRPACSF